MNVLPPIVKETMGREARVLQSTIDSPIGLGSRSQSCSMAKDLSQPAPSCEIDDMKNMILVTSPDWCNSVDFPLSVSDLAHFASIKLPSCMQNTMHHSDQGMICHRSLHFQCQHCIYTKAHSRKKIIAFDIHNS